MKVIIALLTIFLTSTSFAQACDLGKLSLSPDGKNFKFHLQSKSPARKWLLVKNNDTGTLYPNQLVKVNNRGVIYGSDLSVNKKGFDFQVFEIDDEEHSILTKHLKTCVAKKDCSMPIKVSGCMIGQATLKIKGK